MSFPSIAVGAGQSARTHMRFYPALPTRAVTARNVREGAGVFSGAPHHVTPYFLWNLGLVPKWMG